MADKAWKRWERQVAGVLGGVRTGPLGFGEPDVGGCGLSVEAKYQKRLSLRAAHIEQARRNERPNEPWILALKEHGMHGGLVVCEAYWLDELYDRRFMFSGRYGSPYYHAVSLRKLALRKVDLDAARAKGKQWVLLIKQTPAEDASFIEACNMPHLAVLPFDQFAELWQTVRPTLPAVA